MSCLRASRAAATSTSAASARSAGTALQRRRADSRRRPAAMSRGDRSRGPARSASALRARCPRGGPAARPALERSKEPRLKGGPHVADALDPARRRQPRLEVSRQSHEGAGKAAVEGAGQERRDAARLDRAVEGLVIVTEPLVVRTVARLVDVEQRHHVPPSAPAALAAVRPATTDRGTGRSTRPRPCAGRADAVRDSLIEARIWSLQLTKIRDLARRPKARHERTVGSALQPWRAQPAPAPPATAKPEPAS